MIATGDESAPGSGIADQPATRMWLVAAVSATAGAVQGVLELTAQVAVEPAQVLAGLVVYPDGNPFHLYEVRLWTLWHQLLALPLAAGISERVLSVAVSGAVGALSFCALALCALAFGARPLVALATPFAATLLGMDRWGFHYPILLVGQQHTYGMAGLAWIVLVYGLLAGGRLRAAAFLLGLAPAVHPSLGALFAAFVALCAPFAPRALWRPAVLASGAAGVLFSISSLVVQRLAFPIDAQLDAAEAARYLGTFVELWDAHRLPLDVKAWNLVFLVCALLFALSLLIWGHERLTTWNRFALRVFATCATGTLAINLAFPLIPAGSVPIVLVVAMPLRFLNFAVLAFVPTAIGLSERWRDLLASRLLLLSVAVTATLGAYSPAIQGVGRLAFCVLPLCVAAPQTRTPASLRFLVFGLLGWVTVRTAWSRSFFGYQGVKALGAWAATTAMLTGAWFGFEPDVRRWLEVERASGRMRGAMIWLERLVALGFAATVVAALLSAAAEFPARRSGLLDASNDPALAAAAQAEGLIAPGPGIAMVQLSTRRPVLLDPEALDMLPYAIAAAPALVRSLHEVYGVDFFAPPRRARHGAVVPNQPTRELWEARSQQDWISIRERFGVSDVLVRPDWKLAIPEIAHSESYALYRIPEPPRP